jgi:cytochrome c55X
MNVLRQGALCLLVSLPILTWADASGVSTATPAPARKNELLHLVRQDCGSCHGLRMEGGLGLPLTPQALQGKDPDGLKLTILQGRHGTTMPPWSPFMSEAEAGWIVDLLMKGLPDAR